MRRLAAFPSGFPGGSCGTKHRRDFYDEKDKPEIGAFALGAGSVFCGLRTGTPHRQFSMEQQRHLWRLSGVYFVDGSASLGAIWEKTEVII
mgnify:FL=1